MWPLGMVLDEGSARPQYLQIVDGIVDGVRRGRLRPGDRLPGTRALAAHLGVNRSTVVTAFDELIAEGWLEARPGSSTRVAQALPPAAGVGRGAPRPGKLPYKLPGRSLPAVTAPVDEPRVLAFGGGLPDLRLIPAAALARAHRRALRRGGRRLLGYGDPSGLLELRVAIAALLSTTRGLAVSADDLVVTRGAQMALYLAAHAVLAPGDAVAVEDLGYAPAWEALRTAGADLLPLPVDEHGLDVDALERLLRRRALQAVYVTPHHQLPTLVTLSAERRLRLLELARRHRFCILEDDYDHEVHFEGSPVLPLAHIDDAGSVLYVGTLSKVLAPGLRLGFLHAAPEVLERARRHRQLIDRQGDQATEAAVAELFEEGEVARHTNRVRRVLRGRRTAALEALEHHLPGVFAVEVPRGGMALWARAVEGDDVCAWAERALAAGVRVAPARRFTFDGRPRPAFRLGYASLTEAEIDEAVRRLAGARASVRHIQK